MSNRETEGPLPGEALLAEGYKKLELPFGFTMTNLIFAQNSFPGSEANPESNEGKARAALSDYLKKGEVRKSMEGEDYYRERPQQE